MAQYMLLLHQLPVTNAQLPPDTMTDVVRRYYEWAQAMREKGKLVGGEKLTAGGVRLVKVKDGKPVVSDGPYAELKDVVGGYFVIEAKDQAEAEAIAKDCPHMAISAANWIEIRPIESMAEMRAQAAAG